MTVDGRTWEINLCEGHLAQFLSRVTPWVQLGRPVKAARRAPRPRSSAARVVSPMAAAAP